MEPVTAVSELSGILGRAWLRATSYHPAAWTESNPALGQCAVTALVVHDLLGGEILRGMVNGSDHFWNVVQSVGELDLTQSQFGTIRSVTPGRPISRELLLANPDTRRRYELLSARASDRTSNSPQHRTCSQERQQSQ